MPTVQQKLGSPAFYSRRRIFTSDHLGVPQLARLIERARDDLISPGVVERDRIHHVSVPVERQKLVSRRSVPYLTTRGEANDNRGGEVPCLFRQPPALCPRTYVLVLVRVAACAAPTRARAEKR